MSCPVRTRSGIGWLETAIPKLRDSIGDTTSADRQTCELEHRATKFRTVMIRWQAYDAVAHLCTGRWVSHLCVAVHAILG